ncbi:MAG TPA: LysR family transcriptional regulator ArgP [Variovorax sp.]|nr:LysR family transcriptional regulator ArgP [Variovorax sp.]
MQIDSRQLAAFDAVLREGSFDGAARALHVTPSAISQRIKGLEERMGRVLIQRASPCVATPAGQALQRHAQQVRLLEADALRPFGLGAPDAVLPLALAVNADSLATWFVAALAAVQAAGPVSFELHVEDQDHSALLLREGRVMAAVTAEPQAVQGCVVEPLGAMRYLAVASPAFMARHFAHGVDAAALAAAPCNVFNAKDALQARFMRRLTRKPLAPPLHRVPGTHGFVHAAVQGLGWGMNPQVLVAGLLARGDLVELVPGQSLDVALYWQHWRVESQALRLLTGAVHAAAAAMLEQG